MVDVRLKRAQIHALSKSGYATSEIARILNVNRSTLYRVIKRGTIQNCPRTGCSVRVTRQRLKNTVRLRVTRNSVRSVRKLVKEVHFSHTTMQRLVRNKLYLGRTSTKEDRAQQQTGVQEGYILRYWRSSLATNISRQLFMMRNYPPFSRRTTTKT